MRTLRYFLLVMPLLLAACADLQRIAPQATATDANAVQSTRSLAGTPVDARSWPSDAWWTTFGDAQLDALMDEALAGSPTLKVAEARTRKALAAAGVAAAALYPQINGDLAITEQRFSEHGIFPPPYAGTWNTLNQMEITLNWEIDFWGKHRAEAESALDQARAAQVDAYAARLALTVAIAQAYVDLQRAYLLLDVAKTTVAEREQVYALTRDRNRAGLDSLLVVKQAQTAVPASRELVVRLEETIAQTRNALAALLGQGPDRGLRIDRPAAAHGTDAALPTLVPAELLGRRPDLESQRLRIAAAQQSIEVARAQFYPNINLAAFVGLQSLGSSFFLNSASRTLGVGPAISLPIFEGGRLRANLRGAAADYDIAVEQYNQSLADAMRDVVDQLAAWRSLRDQRVQQAEALAHAQEAYDLALLRYREGLGNYLDVLSVETPLLEQQSLEADLRARELSISIALVRALGGGFDAAAIERATLPPLASATQPATGAH
jgi:NodT family efflux transporter outer membrane factor (OMF) lipoprotein